MICEPDPAIGSGETGPPARSATAGMRAGARQAMVRSILFLAFVFSAARGSGSLFAAPAQENVDRLAKIPAAAVKMSPATDEHPPVLLSDEFEDPLPVPGAVNTAGAEDSPFIPPDGGTLFFFFTPDVTVPVEKQLLDGATGSTYRAKRAAFGARRSASGCRIRASSRWTAASSSRGT
jgi:hypothetical protein